MLLVIIYIILCILLFNKTFVNIDKIIDNCKYNDTPLCSIMEKNGSDKSTYHSYTTLYYDLFKDLQYDNLNVFEVGLGTKNPDIPSSMSGNVSSIPGGSIKGWRDFFVNSDVYGADIDKDILFTDDRIKTYYVDQLDPNTIKNMWSEIDKKFDIIIDDGLHTAEANYSFLMNSHDMLKDNGIYVIEDINDIPAHEKHMNEYKKIFKTVRLVKVPGRPGREDNVLIVMQK